MKVDEAGVLLDALHGAFPEFVIGVETAQIYARFFADLDFERGGTAVATWIAFDGKRFPRISELRALCADSMPDADQAFKLALDAVGTYGMYREPVFAHPAVGEAVAAISWREFCLSDNMPALRAHFAKAYEAVKRRRVAAESKSLIAGIVKELPQRALDGAARKQLKP